MMNPSATAGIRLPWEEVKALDALQVARRFGLEKAREPRKFSCVSCSSSDALHAYGDGGFKCFSCGGAWSSPDALALYLRMDPSEACREIALAFGIPIEEADSRPWSRASRRPTSRRAVPRPVPPATAPVDLGLLARINSDVVSTLGWFRTGAEALGEAGAQYLSGRGLDPDSAGEYGFRTLTRERWEVVEERLFELADPKELIPTGWFQDRGEGPEFSPPWGGKATALLIPYQDLTGRVVGVRFRNLHSRTKRDRYRDLPGVDLPLPFGADALQLLPAEPGRHVLHLVEGELNACSIRQAGGLAVGLPGAGRSWGAGWPRLFGNAFRVVLWFDGDEAGRGGVQHGADSLAKAFGRSWCKSHVRHQPLPPGRDANDLLKAGELREWIDPRRFA